MRLEAAQIVQSAQVWVCDTCGSQDHKSCACNSAAHMELLAAKREAERQRGRQRREKAKENQEPRPVDATVENIDETIEGAARRAYFAVEPEPEPGDDDQTVWRRGLMFRARAARVGAEFENWSHFKIDRHVVGEARAAADAWTKLARYLEELQHGKQGAA